MFPVLVLSGREAKGMSQNSADQRDPNALASPFVLMDKLFGPYAFSQSKKTNLNEKLEVYFQEFDLLPLWVQENYLKHKFSRANNISNPREAARKKMEITLKAADAISDGDLIDRMIHGYVAFLAA
jgi:replication factor C subunit 1